MRYETITIKAKGKQQKQKGDQSLQKVKEMSQGDERMGINMGES